MYVVCISGCMWFEFLFYLHAGSNPFGTHDSDDEDEEEDVGFSSLQQGVSGYHVAPLSRGSMDALVPGQSRERVTVCVCVCVCVDLT